MLLLNEYESYLSMSVVNYAQKKKILLICLLSHTTHLLQPLNVGLFDSLQHYYVLKVNRLAQLSISHVSKPQFLEILASAQLKAYTTKNVALHERRRALSSTILPSFLTAFLMLSQALLLSLLCFLMFLRPLKLLFR
jgi:hypothetical protein